MSWRGSEGSCFPHCHQERRGEGETHQDSWSGRSHPPRDRSDWRRHRPTPGWCRCWSRTGKPQNSRMFVSSWKLWWWEWSRCSQCPSCPSDISASQSWSGWWWTHCCPPSLAGSHRRCEPADNTISQYGEASLWLVTDPPGSSHVSPVIDVEMVIAVHLEPLELQQELLHHGLRLEGDDAVLVPLVATLEDDAVHRLLDLGEKVALFALITDLMHLI